MKEALFYKKLASGQVECFLCSHYCKINTGAFGFCQVRQNLGQVLYSHNYGKLISCAIDPIEKKPLYHFLPGSTAFSIAAPGCNFRCQFCQNWQISQGNSLDCSAAEDVAAEKIVALALNSKCPSIAYTYSEPAIYFEYAFDIAQLAKKKKLRNVFISNGYISAQAVRKIAPYLDAVNIDLKSFNDGFYRKLCSATLQPVLDTIRLMKELGVWVEVTTLIIPGENDSAEELKKIAEFIAGVDKNIPWHVSGFYGAYKFIDRAATPLNALERAVEIGKACALRYVYAGNISGRGNITYCASCDKELILRQGFKVVEQNLDKGKCVFCKTPLSGVF
ncbi:MAG: AmmeMemoRadiSam system radical SAM enzyme [Candidatus Omnitrophica bacterium]|jgi:pyruvate formate lyase activating enzyme|nr:AmmeMemoRadiSam system radical SAM enzyme [Candidatus Omnitrophota bacterium]